MKIHQPLYIAGKPGGFVSPECTSKDWGYELLFHNGEYCMKVLQLHPHATCRRHLHIEKEESFYVAEGSVFVDFEDGRRGKFRKHLVKGDCFHVPPGMPHSLSTQQYSATIVEASTHHKDSDSIRI
jgi:uncharacterized RmlC-like cupin family protein